MKRYILLLLALHLAAIASALHVGDFGAAPNDDQCDTVAINQAIAAAAEQGDPEVRFEPGVYRLVSPDSAEPQDQAYINIVERQNIAMVGAIDAAGRPATRLERVLKLDNDADPVPQINIDKSKKITLRNFVLANNPPLGSTARVTAVDREKDVVEVEVLPDLPFYDGMRCASAHVSDLETGKLKRFGRTPDEATLTIGLGIKSFWQAVPESGERKLRMSGSKFAEKVEVGDGISWHHKAAEARNQTMAMNSEDLVFENIIMPNVSNMGMLAGFNRNLTFRKVRFEPENGNLAVGGRDGLHLSMNSGKLLVEDCYFKGLRMDPLVVRKSFGIVVSVDDNRTVTLKPGYPVSPGGKIRFWVGESPVDLTVANIEKVKGVSSTYRYKMEQDLPGGTKEGSATTYLTYSVDEGTIRNSVFEDNFGSPIINMEDNLTIEGCTFDNNAYQVKFGPNRQSGGFVRDNIFRNNIFRNSCWVDITRRGRPSSLQIHSQSMFFNDPMYNGNILIQGNTFTNDVAESDAVAVDVRNAVSVTFENNMFNGYPEPVVVDPKNTRDIKLQQLE
jgi:hypothetical protein